MLDRLRERPAIIGAAALSGCSVYVLATNWGPVAAGHPSYLFMYGAFIVIAAGGLFRGLRSQGKPKRRWVSLIGGFAQLLLAGLALWLSPFGAEERALYILREPGDLIITETPDAIVVELGDANPVVGVVFHPGARVDARAYLATLEPLAVSGYRVVIVKEPLGIAFLSAGLVRARIERDTDIRTWVVAGHSLGGVVACSEAASNDVEGLLLWASYPASDISDADWLEVGSIYGTEDAISEPDRIRESEPLLPDQTTFTQIVGGIHSYFGDYGIQRGDGEPGVDRETARGEIADASLELLARIRSRS